MIEYKVGDVIEQHCFGDAKCSRLVRVTGKIRNVKNGRAGFDGILVDGGYSVWGYDSDVFRVVTSSVDRFEVSGYDCDATQEALAERAAVESANDARIPTPQELLDDPCTSFWVKDVIRVARTKDVVDVAGAFALLAKVFESEANYTLYGTRDGKRASKF